jgi:hypothetical protein
MIARRCIGLVLLSAIGCAAAADRPSEPAAAPAPTPVPDVVLPYDAALPRFLLAIEPMKVGALGAQAAAATVGTAGPDNRAVEPAVNLAVADLISSAVTAELVKLLADVGNFAVIDFAHFTAPGADHRVVLRPGEVGPFIVQGVVREFSEVTQSHQQRRSGGWLGSVLGLAGGAAGVPGAGAAGAGVSILNPTYENANVKRTGSVALDLQLVEDRSGRLIGTIAVKEKFSTESAASGASLLGFGNSGSTTAASAVGEATRIALNRAVQQIYDKFTALNLRPEDVRTPDAAGAKPGKPRRR